MRSSIAAVPASEWDRLSAHEPNRATPFLSHAWLDALEQSGAVTPERGWSPRHILLRRGGRLVAAAPAYLKRDSDGDFGRDWHWADAAARAGIPYYPKLVLGVPFTPATGRRLIAAPGEDRRAMTHELVAWLRELCAEEGIRSIHALYAWQDEAQDFEEAGLALRLDFQYHWVNAGYRDFEGFLARFASKRRNAIRRERAAPPRQGIAIRSVSGEELAASSSRWARDIDRLHEASVSRMVWGRRFLDRGFFERALLAMAPNLEVVEARRGGRLIAMAFNVVGAERLYGRYWGAVEEHPFLHFNVALYHSVEQCILRGLQVFEGGAGGEHKLARGFEPAEIWSAHTFADPRLEAAIRRHLREERKQLGATMAHWRATAAVLRRPESVQRRG